MEIDLGYICNYKCSYCPPLLHSGKGWLEYDNVIALLEKVSPARIILPGGEPTLYPQIVELMQYIKKMDSFLFVVSNATKSLEWWEKHNELIDVLTFSLHIEKVNIEEFIKKVKAVTKKRYVTINVSMIPNRFDEIFEIIRRIRVECEDTYITPKMLVDTNTGLSMEYTDKQRMAMRKILPPKVVRTTESLHNVKVYKVYSDGVYEETKPQELIATGDIKYQGWKCWKGLQFLKVTPYGEIYQATCEVSLPYTKPIGNIYDLDNVKWTTEPQICTKKQCNCISALRGVRKEKV